MKAKEKNLKVKEACSECSEDKEKEYWERVNKVASILKNVNYETEATRAEAIRSFSKANLSLDEIENLAIPMRSDYLSGQVYRKGVY